MSCGGYRHTTTTKALGRGGGGRSGGGGGMLIRERKAAKQLGVIMSAFILCWLPYFITFMVIAYCPDCISPQVHQFTIWLGYINSTLNPFLYPMCNASFKRAFKRILGMSET
jgi:histamine receptor H1